MPVPSTPSQKTAAISYPALDLAPLDAELYPSLENVAPKTPTPGIPVAAPAATTARKATQPPFPPSAFADSLGSPTMPGAFGGAAGRSDFTFDFPFKLGEYGRKRVGDIKDRAREICAKMEPGPSTPAHAPPTPAQRAATTGRRSRFSDMHKRQFERMESIATHYAAKRNKVATPQNPQKGIKRTQSQATLEEKSLPPTPSPVKKQPEPEVRRSKRTKIEPVSSFASKISRLAGTPKTNAGGAARPPPASDARAAVSRRVLNMKKPLPALPQLAAEPSVRLVPPSLNGRAPPKTPATPPPPNRALHNLAPATVAAAPKFALQQQPKPPGTPAPSSTTTPGNSNSPYKSIAGAMTEARPRVVKQLRKLRDMATKESDKLASPRMGGGGRLSPIKVTEAVDLEDPFGSDRPGKGWAFQPPPAMPAFPKAPVHDPSQSSPRRASALNALLSALSPRKRKSGDQQNDDGQAEQSPVRKRLRFDGMNVEEMKGKSKILLDKARLEFLATPKKKIDRIRGTKSTAKKSARKPAWK